MRLALIASFSGSEAVNLGGGELTRLTVIL